MRTHVAVIAVVLAAAVGIAGAQSDDLARKTAAEAAFRQGKDQIAAGQTAAACESFAKSQELDPQLGTQYNLGLCYEKLGKSASAWGLYSVLAETDTNKGRKADAAKRAKALAPKLVRVLLVVRGDTPNVEVSRDGTDITAAIGVATPVDPGTSMLTAHAEGYEDWNAEVAVMGEGTTVTVEIPSLTKKPEPVPDVVPDPVPDVIVPPPPPPIVVDPDPGRGRRRLGLISAGTGVVLVGVGAAFGVMAGSANDSAKRTCGGDVNDCRGDLAAAQDKVDAARTDALISTIGLAAGGVAVVAGAVLYLTAPKARDSGVAVAPSLHRGGAGLTVVGRF